MKKLLVLLMMFMTIINISAQESNELQKIDSLQYQIDRLQHNYDYFVNIRKYMCYGVLLTDGCMHGIMYLHLS